MAVVDRAHRPADDEPRVQVEDRGQEELAARAISSSVVSPTQRWLGASASNSRSSMLGAIGWSCSLIVVHLYRRRTRAGALLLHQPDDPLATDVLAIAANSAWTRGLP